ncbi:putative ABC exporter domain-containing protein [Clostridium sardiniense]|uniref:ABC exporter domain-containing protein n=1 Tax=Clostridium sardiniense TaxID=29369 RepID=A0ABS7KV86_CLOSR|nr:putative ABC exporter domain-containing protein [Clostridium sardiniense]MBM7835481.1 hypothetical protein [Clostridium sardiniense]MBY0754725.1 putative ABC exporter domain-containing protein [Clostridium sardiniense]
MSPFLYLAKRNFINYFKSFKSKPSKVIPYIFFIIILGFSFSSVFLGEKNTTFTDSKIFTGIVTIVSLLLILISIYSGITRKSFSYSMADVNLIFTSEISPTKVLLYGFLKEIGYVFIFGLFLIFQIPMLIDKFGITAQGIFILFMLIILISITTSALSLMIYGIFTHFPKGKQIAKNIFISIIILVFVYFALTIYKQRGNLFNSILNLSNDNFWNLVPLVGFCKMIGESIFSGFSISMLLSIIGLIASSSLFVIVLCKLNLDFYEDVLSSAETREAAMSYKNSGYDVKQLDYSKFKYKPWTRKNITDNYSSEFSKAIFRRQLLEYKKTGFYFLNLMTLILILGAIFFAKVVKGDIFIFLCIIVYILVLSVSASKWSLEFNTPTIFLIPDSSVRKLFYSTLTSIIKVSIDGVIVFLLIGALLRTNPIEIILCIITYISFGFLTTYGGVFNYKIFDRVSNQVTKSLVMFFSIFVYIAPAILIGAFIGIKLSFLGHYAIYAGVIIYNLIASIILMNLSKSIFDTIEL